MRKKVSLFVVALAMSFPALTAQAETPVSDLSSVQGLSSEQRAAISAYTSKTAASSAGTKAKGTVSTQASSSRRASYYRGSALMWTRDNVDFGFNWSTVTWTSAFQQAGWIFPNVARNRGISKYYDTATNDRFRALNTIGAGVPTPWGDVKVYSSDFTHRLSVTYNGAWSAWSD